VNVYEKIRTFFKNC